MTNSTVLRNSSQNATPVFITVGFMLLVCSNTGVQQPLVWLACCQPLTHHSRCKTTYLNPSEMNRLFLQRRAVPINVRKYRYLFFIMPFRRALYYSSHIVHRRPNLSPRPRLTAERLENSAAYRWRTNTVAVTVADTTGWFKFMMGYYYIVIQLRGKTLTKYSGHA